MCPLLLILLKLLLLFGSKHCLLHFSHLYILAILAKILAVSVLLTTVAVLAEIE